MVVPPAMQAVVVEQPVIRLLDRWLLAGRLIAVLVQFFATTLCTRQPAEDVLIPRLLVLLFPSISTFSTELLALSVTSVKVVITLSALMIGRLFVGHPSPLVVSYPMRL